MMSFRTAIKTPPPWSARTYAYVRACGHASCVRTCAQTCAFAVTAAWLT